MIERPPEGQKVERPLGLPVGSVRSLIVLILLIDLSIIALLLVGRIVTSSAPESETTVKDLALLVIGAIVGALATATAFYFKDRAQIGGE